MGLASKSVTDLSVNDLQYLEQLLGKELSSAIDQENNWKTTHHYELRDGKKQKILRCLNAVRKQKSIASIEK